MHHSHMLMIYFYALKMQHILLLCNSEILEISAWLSVLPSRHLCHSSHRPKYLDSLKSIILRQICCQKIIEKKLHFCIYKEKENFMLKYSGGAHQRKLHRWIMNHSLGHSTTWILGDLQVSAILMSYMVTSTHENK